MKLYVGNLNFKTTDDSLRALFTNYGQVDDVAVVMDRETGRSRGFGFVTMPNDGEAQAAIEALNGQEFESRAINVNEAKPKPAGSGGPRGGGGGRGGYNRGGGGDRW